MRARARIVAGVGRDCGGCAGAGVWIIRGPGPMAFSGGPKVALPDYHDVNPTGVPATLAGAISLSAALI